MMLIVPELQRVIARRYHVGIAHGQNLEWGVVDQVTAEGPASLGPEKLEMAIIAVEDRLPMTVSGASR